MTTGPGPSLTVLDGVRWRGEPVPGRGAVLLAALVRAAPGGVGVDELVAAVWGPDESPPDHPDKALQVLASRVRSRTVSEAVERTPAGYRLGLPADQVDALHLARLLGTATEAWRAGDLDVVRHATTEAVAMRVADSVLDGLVGRAVEQQGRARLLLGRVHLARGEADEALPLLEAALAREPDDETVLADVLRAEADARGVPAALATYASYAERVGDRLGAEPGEALRRVHAELLARDAPVREGLRYEAAPMVGRDADVAALRALLARSRVVSIVGAGGLGKTRMAHLVGRLASQPVVHVVELTGVSTLDGVLPEIASALGVRDSVALESARHPTRGTHVVDLRRRVAERLGGAATLLVLDNCEHVIEAAADLVAWLVATCDRLTVLTTSRAPLGIAAEEVYLLSPLGDDDAVELFGRRARAARSDVRLEEPEVRTLVARLDGLPLAVELAAAKVRVMSVAEITRRLDDRFALLTGGDRSAPARHRTLEAVIDWSWQLLRPEDRATLRILSSFPDGFGADAAESVLGHDPLAGLSELVDQSLLVVREDDDGVRYRFLETVREYGAARRADDGETHAVADRLRSWAVEVSRQWAARIYTPDQVRTMSEVRREAGNLAAIMRAALESGDLATLVPTLRLLAAFWSISGEHLAVLGVTRSALDLMVSAADQPPAGTGDAERLGLLVQLTVNEMIFTGRSRPETIGVIAPLVRDGAPGVEGVEPRDLATGRVMVALAESGVDGRVLRGAGTERGAAQLAVVTRLTEDPDPGVRMVALMWATQEWENAGELAAAIETGRRALALCDGSDGPWTRALVASQLAGLCVQFGDWPGCRHYCEAALPVMTALGAEEDVIQLRSVLALADLAEGRLAEAKASFTQIVEDPRSQRTIGWNVGLVGMAEVALAEGRVDEGLTLYREGLRSDRSAMLDSYQIDVLLSPWALYGEAGTVFASVVHGRRDGVRDLARELRDKLPKVLAEQATRLDFPVTGCVVIALAGFSMTEPGASADHVDRSLRAFAIAHRFGYQRVLPSMSWVNVERLAREVGGADGEARLASYVEEYAARANRDLLEEVARSALGE